MAKKQGPTKEELATKRKEDLGNIINKFDSAFSIPEKEAKQKSGLAKPVTQDYREFKEEERLFREKNRYERTCEWAETFNLSPWESMQEELTKAIRFTGLKVTPKGVAGCALLAALATLVPCAVLLLFAGFPLIFNAILVGLPFFIGYQFLNYPVNYATLVRIRSGKDIVVAILYIIVYMKSVPNFEGAVKYAANNLTGKLAQDLRLVLWKVEVGMFNTVDDALQEYIMQWKDYNKEFIEGIQLIRESMAERNPTKRDILLDRAVDVVLSVTGEKMERYSRDLETPISILHSLGVLLPVMGMIVFPLLSIFLSENIPRIGFYLFIGYNVLLPAVLFYFMKQSMDRRPSTHSSIDISQHPEVTTLETFRMTLGKKVFVIPALPVAFGAAFLLTLPGLNYALSTNFYHGTATVPFETGFFSMLMSISVVFALGVGICTYYYLTSFQKIRLQEEISSIEGEFEEALFALGNRLSGGTPIESGLERVLEDTKDLTIYDVFLITLKNIHQLNMTFKQALFDPQYGSLRYYPSNLIKTVMRSVAEAVDKGTRAASLTMITISRYLRSIHLTQDKIDNLLSSTVSSMKFQAYVLVPAISGVVVSVSQLIIIMITKLTATFSTLNTSNSEFGSSFGTELFSTSTIVPPEIMQLVVGIYVIQILVLLGMFINRIQIGDDPIREHDTIWKLVLGGFLMYIVVLAVVTLLFSPLIGSIGAGLGPDIATAAA